MRKTYLDVGVLIAAWRADRQVHEKALGILNDPSREFVSSRFAEIELLPHAIHNGNTNEVAFYRSFFTKLGTSSISTDAILDTAMVEGSLCGASGIDACHLAAAILAEAVELVTTEKPSKPMFGSTKIAVVSLA